MTDTSGAQRIAREGGKCEHLVMVMLHYPTFSKGWVCRDCGETIMRDAGYIIGLVALKVKRGDL